MKFCYEIKDSKFKASSLNIGKAGQKVKKQCRNIYIEHQLFLPCKKLITLSTQVKHWVALKKKVRFLSLF